MTLAEATILVVDDEPALLEIFSIWLARNGSKVMTAANGVDALKVLTTQRVDALISDLRMPLMDGVSLIRKVYELRIQIPSIIFVSGFGDIDAREMFGLGVEAMLAKPLGPKQLIHALERTLKDRSDLWKEPLPGVIKQNLELRFQGLEPASTSCEFSIGRGGCCFRVETSLLEEQPIKLSVHFDQETLLMEAHGIVRWYRPKEHRVGIEFTYLTPSSRSWIIPSLKGEALRSFIPHC